MDEVIKLAGEESTTQAVAAQECDHFLNYFRTDARLSFTTEQKMSLLRAHGPVQQLLLDLYDERSNDSLVRKVVAFLKSLLKSHLKDW